MRVNPEKDMSRDAVTVTYVAGLLWWWPKLLPSLHDDLSIGDTEGISLGGPHDGLEIYL